MVVSQTGARWCLVGICFVGGISLSLALGWISGTPATAVTSTSLYDTPIDPHRWTFRCEPR